MATPSKNRTGEANRQRQEIKRLRSTHELYDKYLPRWQFYLDSYEGGDDYTSNTVYLDQHFREADQDYKDRLKRAHLLNYCETLTDFTTDYIFADAINRHGGDNDAADTFYTDFLADVNKKGEDVDTFMRQVCTETKIFGEVFVLVDSPTVASRLTKAQEQRLGIRPYWVLIRPTEMLDWVYDPFDKMLYMKRQQIVEFMDGTTKRTVERYYEWTPEQVKITDVDITQGVDKPVLGAPQNIDNRLAQKVVPIQRFIYQRSMKDRGMAVSYLIDIARNNREVYNLTSLLQEFLYRQCFNMLAMESDPNETDEEESQSSFGTTNVLLFPKDAKHAPHYVSPPVDPAKFIAQERQLIVQEMYKRTHQDLVNELTNGNKASGHSKQMSFSTTVPKIAAMADILERGEMALMSLTYLYRKQTWKGKIKYKDRYEITNLTDAMQQLQTLFKDMQLQSDTFIKQQMIRMVHEFDGKIPADQMKQIEKEINNMNMTEWYATQKLAYIGRAAQSDLADVAVEGKVPAQDAKALAAQSAAERKPSSSAELASESSKTPKPGGRKAQGKK